MAEQRSGSQNHHNNNGDKTNVTPIHNHEDYYGPQAEDYSHQRPLYPPRLFETIVSEIKNQNIATDLAIDVACGSGQATAGIVDHFKRVLAVDTSGGQLDMAKITLKHCDHVEYHVGKGEELSSIVGEGSCDVVICAEALHWLHFDLFMKEVKKVLKPNGMLVIVGYWVGYMVEPELERSWDKYMRTIEQLAPFDPNKLRNEYKLNFPFKTEHRWTFVEHVEKPIDDVIGMARTFSCLQIYRDKYSSSEDYVDPLEQLEKEWRAASKKDTLEYDMPFYLIILSDNENKAEEK